MDAGDFGHGGNYGGRWRTGRVGFLDLEWEMGRLSNKKMAQE